MQLIAVLITCHNRKDKTLACLCNLYLNKLPESFSLSIYLVNDGCTDDTAKEVKEKYPLVEIIDGNGTLYWNRGMHKAWISAANQRNYDFYLWLNDDTFLFENAISELLSASKESGQKSIIVASTCSINNGDLTYGGFGVDGEMLKPTGKLNKVITFNGNCVLVPKYVFSLVGTLDPVFHHAIGDIDYGLRAAQKKIHSYIAPNFLAFCEEHKTLPKWCLKETPLKTRIKTLYSPLGNSHPYYYFIFELRHYGLFTALKHLFSIHLRVLYPQLWTK